MSRSYDIRYMRAVATAPTCGSRDALGPKTNWWPTPASANWPAMIVRQADAVIGGHPRVRQDIEIVNGKPGGPAAWATS